MTGMAFRAAFASLSGIFRAVGAQAALLGGLASLFWRHPLHLFCFVVMFALTYVRLCVSIVRFKSQL